MSSEDPTDNGGNSNDMFFAPGVPDTPESEWSANNPFRSTPKASAPAVSASATSTATTSTAATSTADTSVTASTSTEGCKEVSGDNDSASPALSHQHVVQLIKHWIEELYDNQERLHNVQMALTSLRQMKTPVRAPIINDEHTFNIGPRYNMNNQIKAYAIDAAGGIHLLMADGTYRHAHGMVFTGKDACPFKPISNTSGYNYPTFDFGSPMSGIPGKGCPMDGIEYSGTPVTARDESMFELPYIPKGYMYIPPTPLHRRISSGTQAGTSGIQNIFSGAVAAKAYRKSRAKTKSSSDLPRSSAEQPSSRGPERARKVKSKGNNVSATEETHDGIRTHAIIDSGAKGIATESNNKVLSNNVNVVGTPEAYSIPTMTIYNSSLTTHGLTSDSLSVELLTINDNGSSTNTSNETAEAPQVSRKTRIHTGESSKLNTARADNETPESPSGSVSLGSARPDGGGPSGTVFKGTSGTSATELTSASTETLGSDSDESTGTLTEKTNSARCANFGGSSDADSEGSTSTAGERTTNSEYDKTAGSTCKVTSSAESMALSNSASMEMFSSESGPVSSTSCAVGRLTHTSDTLTGPADNVRLQSDATEEICGSVSEGISGTASEGMPNTAYEGMYGTAYEGMYGTAAKEIYGTANEGIDGTKSEVMHITDSGGLHSTALDAMNNSVSGEACAATGDEANDTNAEVVYCVASLEANGSSSTSEVFGTDHASHSATSADAHSIATMEIHTTPQGAYSNLSEFSHGDAYDGTSGSPFHEMYLSGGFGAVPQRSTGLGAVPKRSTGLGAVPKRSTGLGAVPKRSSSTSTLAASNEGTANNIAEGTRNEVKSAKKNSQQVEGAKVSDATIGTQSTPSEEVIHTIIFRRKHSNTSCGSSPVGGLETKQGTSVAGTITPRSESHRHSTLSSSKESQSNKRSRNESNSAEENSSLSPSTSQDMNSTPAKASGVRGIITNALLQKRDKGKQIQTTQQLDEARQQQIDGLFTQFLKYYRSRKDKNRTKNTQTPTTPSASQSKLAKKPQGSEPKSNLLRKRRQTKTGPPYPPKLEPLDLGERITTNQQAVPDTPSSDTDLIAERITSLEQEAVKLKNERNVILNTIADFRQMFPEHEAYVRLLVNESDDDISFNLFDSIQSEDLDDLELNVSDMIIRK